MTTTQNPRRLVPTTARTPRRGGLWRLGAMLTVVTGVIGCESTTRPPDPSELSLKQSVSLDRVVDGSVLRVLAPRQAKIGDLIHYRVSATNEGPSPVRLESALFRVAWASREVDTFASPMNRALDPGESWDPSGGATILLTEERPRGVTTIEAGYVVGGEVEAVRYTLEVID